MNVCEYFLENYRNLSDPWMQKSMKLSFKLFKIFIKIKFQCDRHFQILTRN